jgi:hypothetical protein
MGKTHWILVSTLSITLVRVGEAQELQILCPSSSLTTDTTVACVANYSPSAVQQQVPLVLTILENGTDKPVPGAVVRLRATAGTVWPDSTMSDDHGKVHAYWYRIRSSDPATVAVEARPGSSVPSGQRGTAFRLVQLQPTPRVDSLGLQFWRTNRAWFERGPLPEPVSVNIYRGTDPLRDGAEEVSAELCRAQRVVFARLTSSGDLRPDTAIPGLMEIVRPAAATSPSAARPADTTYACFARAVWTLGEGVGTRNIRATLIPSASVEATARIVDIQTHSRALPRIVIGPTVTQRQSYYGVRPESRRIIRIERPQPDGTKLIFDSTAIAPAGVDTVRREWKPSAFIGVTSPIVPAATWLAVTIGVDVNDPANNWFFGASALRLFGGLSTEALPIDLHVIGHFSRVPEVENRAACAAGTSCRVDRETRFQSLGLLLTVDATSLVTEVIKKLGS